MRGAVALGGVAALCVTVVVAFVGAGHIRAQGPASERAVTSATKLLSPELRSEQDDLALNRGMLWVEEGRRLWDVAPAAGKPACSACHGAAGDALRGVAARYPAVDRQTQRLMNLEGRINACRERHQGQVPFAYESEELLALTSLVAFQARGTPIDVAVDGAAASNFALGRSLFETRQGQLNLACSQCHDDSVGRRLRGDRISSGLGSGYPAYRLEWQGMGSLHRRLKACQIGVRAEEMAPESDEHLALELYLAWRGRGLPVEAPAIRR